MTTEAPAARQDRVARPATTASVSVTKHPDRPGYLLTASQWLPRSVDDVWPFFCDAHNLEAITPPILSFEVLTPKPIEMKAGALIDYKLKIRGVPIRWRTEIAIWEPPHRFMDRQLRGPYRWWEHEHTFEAEDGGTRCRDRVAYHVPGGPLAPMANRLLVQRDVVNIFNYRGQKLAEMFG